MSERIDPECPRCEGIELVWSEGYGYQCPACSLFVAIPERNPRRVQGAEASGPGQREMTTRAQVAIFEELFGRSFGEGDRGSRQFDQAGDLAEVAISAAFRSEPAHRKESTMTDQLSLARVVVGSVIGASPQDGLVIEIIRALDQQRLIAAHDVRDRLHAKCDCVPNLGPAHCHLCEHENGTPTPWEQCSAVTGPSRDYAGEIEQAAILAPLSDDEYGQGYFRGLCRAADIVRGQR